MLQLNNVSYRKSKSDLVNSVSATVHAGDRLTIFGPNGAGKSTLMRLMAGIIKSTSGTIMYNDSLQTKNAIGYIPQQLALFENLTVKEHLRFYQKMTGNNSKSFMNEMIETLQLKDFWNKQIDELSGGMKRKVNLAVGMIQQPKIVFLDEPFVGVDLAAKHDMLNWLNQLNSRGITIVFVTHDWQVIRELASKMWLMENGELLQKTTVDEVVEDRVELTGVSTALDKMVSFHRT
ncbi:MULTISPECIES: ABC transporter ATP-binding protein [Allobacillus]|uniref:ABC transporter ATP-binding protein n=1 Tax=Allobacillus salarius TaxID=1955272 RepID=A0A556PNP2_9BACI|nr:ABC transporter ATP-binding protein [Allobacillus salarius]TSJ66001.1 ABC transporter ATP-binding protein [Allobacillus salarius]